ncbi:MAG: hypothetical protein AAF360_15985 [Pseudomonadota bacterium]
MRLFDFARTFLAATVLMAPSVDAAWRIGLQALSSDGGRAIIAYGAEWVEVDLAEGGTTLLTPPPTCSWTSASYAPKGEEFVLTAHCSSYTTCDLVRTGLWRSHPTWGATLIARAAGRRWNGARWSVGPGGRDDVIVTETPVTAPRATGIDDLGRGSGCERGQGRFVSVSLASGRAAQLDILPRGWTAIAALAAAPGQLLATLRVRNADRDDSLAETQAAEICAAAEPEWRSGVCGPEGMELHALWSDGDWRLFDDPKSGGGRIFATAGLEVIARERCTGERIGGRLKAACRATVEGPGVSRRVDASAGLFGDVALSADGRVFATLAAGRGLRIRRFELIDLETGEATDVSHLLDLEPPWDAAR